jgi:hypothetical protein
MKTLKYVLCNLGKFCIVFVFFVVALVCSNYITNKFIYTDTDELTHRIDALELKMHEINKETLQMFGLEQLKERENMAMKKKRKPSTRQQGIYVTQNEEDYHSYRVEWWKNGSPYEDFGTNLSFEKACETAEKVALQIGVEDYILFIGEVVEVETKEDKKS